MDDQSTDSKQPDNKITDDVISAPNNKAIKQAQLKKGIVVALVAAFLLSVLFMTIFGQGSTGKSSTHLLKPVKAPVTHPVDLTAVKANWQDNIAHQLNDDEEKARVLDGEFAQLKKINDIQQLVLNEQNEEIAALKAQFLSLQESTMLPAAGIGMVSTPASPQMVDSLKDETLHIDTLKLTKIQSESEVAKTAQNYVPSGSFVEGILLGGLDAHAGVSSQTDPHPVLIRVLDDGVLPNNRNSQLTNCRMIGAGYGDISSERAFIRLERMSCEQHGFFTDYPVYGYVTGPDGKDGIRGKVVTRDGAVIQRAFVGGLFSGLSDATSQSFTTQSISPLGSVESIKSGDVLAYGGASGAGNAMELYAKYNIKRAELYQPVIEIPAGTKINVVFNRGFYLDGLGQSDPGKLSGDKSHADYVINVATAYEEEMNDQSSLFTQ